MVLGKKKVTSKIVLGGTKGSWWESAKQWMRDVGGRNNFKLVYQIVSAILSAVSLVNLLPIVFVAPSDPSHVLARTIDYVLCGVFFIDFLLQFMVASNRWQYMRHQGWLDLCSSIAWIDFLRITRIIRLFHFFRTLREMKGLLKLLVRNSTLSVPLFISISTVLILYFTATMILQFEGEGGGAIQHPLDAVWWAVVTITTVGYGDLVPTTFSGKMLGIFLMIYGVAFYGSVSGFLASWLVEMDDEERDTVEFQQLEIIQGRLDHIEAKLDRIIDHHG